MEKIKEIPESIDEEEVSIPFIIKSSSQEAQKPVATTVLIDSSRGSLRDRSKSFDKGSLSILGSINDVQIVEQNKVSKLDEKLESIRKESLISSSNKIQGWRRYLGIIYTLLAVNMLSLATTIMKKYSHIHPLNMSIWLAPATTFVSLLFIIYAVFFQKKSISEGILPLNQHKMDLLRLWVRAVTSALIGYATVAAFKYVTAADVRTVVSASVIVVYIFGWMFLGEKCGVVPTLVALVALAGIGIMTRPPALTGAKEFESGTLIGIGLSFVCMILVSINIVIIRTLPNVHHAIMNLVGYIWGLGQAIILSLAFGVFAWPTMNELVGLSCAGLAVALALAFLVLALQIEEAGVVALIRTSEVIFVFIWQMIIVGTYPDLFSVIGATLVMTGVIVVSLRKWVSSLPKEHPKRKLLGFLLF